MRQIDSAMINVREIDNVLDMQFIETLAYKQSAVTFDSRRSSYQETVNTSTKAVGPVCSAAVKLVF